MKVSPAKSRAEITEPGIPVSNNLDMCRLYYTQVPPSNVLTSQTCTYSGGLTFSGASHIIDRIFANVFIHLLVGTCSITPQQYYLFYYTYSSTVLSEPYQGLVFIFSAYNLPFYLHTTTKALPQLRPSLQHHHRLDLFSSVRAQDLSYLKCPQ